VEAITGRRILYFGEIRRMIAAENIVTAYLSRRASQNWGKWAQDNPALEKIILDAEVLANG
jgi:hypothetical protein